MVKYYEYACTRLGENLESAKKWFKGEALLGLKNSIFICENGKLEIYVDCDEGEKFHNYVKSLTPKMFDTICHDFFKAIEDKDLVRMHCALAIFDELDTFDLGTEDMKRRLMRVREATESKSYEIKQEEGVKDFIICKGKVYKPDLNQRRTEE